jgi:hypothetical protein
LANGYAKEAIEKISRINRLGNLFGNGNSQQGGNGSINMLQGGQTMSSTGGAFGNGQQHNNSFGQQNQLQQNTNPFNQNHSQQTNIFNTQLNPQPTHSPFLNQPAQLPNVQFDPKVVDSMKGPVLEQMGQILMQGRMYPLLAEFLKSYGVSESVLETLFGMGLTTE